MEREMVEFEKFGSHQSTKHVIDQVKVNDGSHFPVEFHWKQRINLVKTHLHNTIRKKRMNRTKHISLNTNVTKLVKLTQKAFGP